MKSTASGAGLGTEGSTRRMPPSEEISTSCPTSKLISFSISGGIGSITDPPTFLNVRRVCMSSFLSSQYN